MTAEKLFEQAINHWRDNKGKGSAFIPNPLDDKAMILGILQRMLIRSPTLEVFIIVNNYNERLDIIQYLEHQENEENNKEFTRLIKNKQIKLLSINLFEDNLEYYNKCYSMLFVYHVEEISNMLLTCMQHSTFVCAIYNKLINDDNRKRLYNICPLLNDFKQNEIDKIRCNRPVEETLIDVRMSENDFKNYKKFSDYITDSIAIFGSFEIIDKARIGDLITGLSAIQICCQIAYKNGWDEHLDMSIPINVQLDTIYSPTALNNRANNVYDFIRNRIQFCTDYIDKINIILNIVKNNLNKNILIINKRAEFATIVSNAINDKTEAICAPYHDKLDKIPATDMTGNPIYYKTGIHIGEQKMIAAQAQKTLAEQQFNKGIINVISTNAAPDKSLAINVDLIIITSPLCEEIENYIYRLPKLGFNSFPINVFTLYCKNTIEEKKINKKQQSNTHKIINKCENNISIEENSNIIIVD